MSKLKQVLQWKDNGYSNRKIAELVGLNKETVNAYINKASAVIVKISSDSREFFFAEFS